MMIYPWGPLLLKQNVDLKIINIILNNIPDRGRESLLDNNSNLKRISFNKEECGYLINLLDSYFLNYFREMGIAKKNLPYNQYILNQSWVNIHKKDQFIPPHAHGYCDLSFVLYLKFPPPSILPLDTDEGNIIFTYGERNDARAKVKNIVKHQIKPEVGELYMFPNNLSHYTTPIASVQSERISLSGNIELL